MNIQQLFFELIQVAIGTRICLSRTQSEVEWGKLYSMSKKQSLVGVCFAAVQKLIVQRQEPPEMLYLTWMGMAAKIQQRNEVVNRQCVALQKQLSAEGIASRVLKGQGVAQVYPEHLHGLRQCGDIDLWMIESKEMVVAWAEKIGVTESAGYLHVGARCFENTEVELHYRPTYCRCLWYNKRLQEFCEEHKDDWTERNGIVVPSWEFDVVYQLSHIYRHLFGLGIGLRQLMDYYFVLMSASQEDKKYSVKNAVLTKTADSVSSGSANPGNADGVEETASAKNIKNISDTLKHLGLYDFAGAVMYVLREVFHMKEQYMIVPVDERRGRALLRDVMQSGNFGHQDEKQREARSTAVGSLMYKAKQWWQLVRLYPAETLSAPVWTMYKRLKG